MPQSWSHVPVNDLQPSMAMLHVSRRLIHSSLNRYVVTGDMNMVWQPVCIHASCATRPVPDLAFLLRLDSLSCKWLVWLSVAHHAEIHQFVRQTALQSTSPQQMQTSKQTAEGYIRPCSHVYSILTSLQHKLIETAHDKVLKCSRASRIMNDISPSIMAYIAISSMAQRFGNLYFLSYAFIKQRHANYCMKLRCCKL